MFIQTQPYVHQRMAEGRFANTLSSAPEPVTTMSAIVNTGLSQAHAQLAPHFMPWNLERVCKHLAGFWAQSGRYTMDDDDRIQQGWSILLLLWYADRQILLTEIINSEMAGESILKPLGQCSTWKYQSSPSMKAVDIALYVLKSRRPYVMTLQRDGGDEDQSAVIGVVDPKLVWLQILAATEDTMMENLGESIFPAQVNTILTGDQVMRQLGEKAIRELGELLLTRVVSDGVPSGTKPSINLRGVPVRINPATRAQLPWTVEPDVYEEWVGGMIEGLAGEGLVGKCPVIRGRGPNCPVLHLLEYGACGSKEAQLCNAMARRHQLCRLDAMQWDNSTKTGTADITYYLGKYERSPRPVDISERHRAVIPTLRTWGVSDGEDLLVAMSEYVQATPEYCARVNPCGMPWHSINDIKSSRKSMSLAPNHGGGPVGAGLMLDTHVSPLSVYEYDVLPVGGTEYVRPTTITVHGAAKDVFTASSVGIRPWQINTATTKLQDRAVNSCWNAMHRRIIDFYGPSWETGTGAQVTRVSRHYNYQSPRDALEVRPRQVSLDDYNKLCGIRGAIMCLSTGAGKTLTALKAIHHRHMHWKGYETATTATTSTTTSTSPTTSTTTSLMALAGTTTTYLTTTVMRHSATTSATTPATTTSATTTSATTSTTTSATTSATTTTATTSTTSTTMATTSTTSITTATTPATTTTTTPPAQAPRHTMILVPDTLVSHWRSEIIKHTDLVENVDYVCLSSSSDVKRLTKLVNPKKPRMKKQAKKTKAKTKTSTTLRRTTRKRKNTSIGGTPEHKRLKADPQTQTPNPWLIVCSPNVVRSKMWDTCQEKLGLRRHPDMLVIDEAHMLSRRTLAYRKLFMSETEFTAVGFTLCLSATVSNKMDTVASHITRDLFQKAQLDKPPQDVLAAAMYYEGKADYGHVKVSTHLHHVKPTPFALEAHRLLRDISRKYQTVTGSMTRILRIYERICAGGQVDGPLLLEVLRNMLRPYQHTTHGSRASSTGVTLEIATTAAQNPAFGQPSDDCVICLCPYDSPVQSACGHAMCTGCARSLITLSRRRCPTCRATFPVTRGKVIMHKARWAGCSGATTPPSEETTPHTTESKTEAKTMEEKAREMATARTSSQGREFRAMLGTLAGGEDDDTENHIESTIGPKLAKFKELVAKFVSDRGAPKRYLVVYTKHDDTAKLYHEALCEHPLVVVCAGANRTGRKKSIENIEAFRSGAADVLLANFKYSTGYDLANASDLIVTDFDLKVSEITQSSGRVTRIGSHHKNVHVHILLTRGGVDELLYMERKAGSIKSLNERRALRLEHLINRGDPMHPTYHLIKFIHGVILNGELVVENMSAEMFGLTQSEYEAQVARQRSNDIKIELSAPTCKGFAVAQVYAEVDRQHQEHQRLYRTPGARRHRLGGIEPADEYVRTMYLKVTNNKPYNWETVRLRSDGTYNGHSLAPGDIDSRLASISDRYCPSLTTSIMRFRTAAKLPTLNAAETEEMVQQWLDDYQPAEHEG